MDRAFPAPDVSSGPTAGESYHFLINTADADLPSSVRPIRDQELFAMLGFPESFAKEALQFNESQRSE